VYESLDRGASFELVDHLPGPACLTWLDCGIRCTLEGCLIGERFTRKSWGGRGTSKLDVSAIPESEVRELTSQTDLVAFRTPLSCQLGANAGATPTSMQFAPLPEQVSLKDSLWLSPWQDWSAASAGSYRVVRGSRRIEKTTALQPLAHPERAGLGVNFNDAGLSYLRAEDLPKVDEPIGNLELAWLPSGRRTWAHARFRDAATFRNGDSYLYSIDKARRLLPEVLSVSGDDAFVQVHTDDEHRLGTYFASQGKAELLPRIPWPFSTVRDPHWLKVDNTWRVFALDDRDSLLMRALRPAGANDAPWTFSAQTIVEPFGAKGLVHERVQPHFADRNAYLVLAFTARGRQLQALDAYELGANASPLGPRTRLPVPTTLSEPPPTCGARERRELKRVIVPLLPRAARPLGFADGKGKRHWLVVSYAIMYASESRACVDALWAETLPGLTPIRAVVSLEDSPHSWIFLSNHDRGETRVEATPVECRFDAGATPPPEFETRTQARFNLEHLPLD